MKVQRFLFSLAVMGVALGAAAQTTYVEQARQEVAKDHKYIYFGDGRPDTTEHARLMEIYYDDQFTHAQDPDAPYFMLMSRDSQMAMGVGGNLTAIGAFDWHGMIDGMDFAPYEIAIPADPSRMNAFQTSIGNSSLFFTAFGRSSRFGAFKIFIQAKFAGGGDSHYFKLKKAYATVGDWTLGYTKSTFTDPAAIPSTVETEGPNSAANDTRMLLRWMHSCKGGFTVALSAETPKNKYDTNAMTQAGNTYMPDFSGFLQYSWAKGQHLRLAGIVKGLRYRDLADARNRYATGWGVNLSTVFNPCRALTVYAAGYTGAGIGSMINDLSYGANDLIAMASKPGHMKAARSFGWYAALQYNFNPRLFSTIVVSQERMLPDEGMAYGVGDYKYGLYGTANVFYHITKRMQVGGEFNIGKRVDMDGAHRLAYRVCALAQFNF